MEKNAPTWKTKCPPTRQKNYALTWKNTRRQAKNTCADRQNKRADVAKRRADMKNTCRHAKQYLWTLENNMCRHAKIRAEMDKHMCRQSSIEKKGYHEELNELKENYPEAVGGGGGGGCEEGTTDMPKNTPVSTINMHRHAKNTRRHGKHPQSADRVQ